MKVIITKYATTSGVTVVEVEKCVDSPNMVATCVPAGCYRVCYHGLEWHVSKHTADADVHCRFEKKRASLEKQLKQLDAKRQQALAAVAEAKL